MKKFILASGSPERAELMKKIVPQFEISVSGAPEIDESSGLSFEAIAMLNAKKKAEAVFKKYSAMGADCVVLGADTIVSSPEGDRLLHKPRDTEEAKAHLRAISGKNHRVITGFFIVGKYKNIMDSVTSTVTMRKLSEAEIESYVTDGHTLDKSGGFDIKELIALGFAEKTEGSIDNIIGLPTEKIKMLISQF